MGPGLFHVEDYKAYLCMDRSRTISTKEGLYTRGFRVPSSGCGQQHQLKVYDA